MVPKNSCHTKHKTIPFMSYKKYKHKTIPFILQNRATEEVRNL